MHSHTDADSSVPFQFGWAFPLPHYFFRENLGFLSVLLLLLLTPPLLSQVGGLQRALAPSSFLCQNYVHILTPFLVNVRQQQTEGKGPASFFCT